MSDQAARLTALDTTQSICVSAPAGSGKTELLSQRVLKLLASAEQPEHILAVTFTRKAAAEMRERILDSLRYAAKNSEPPTEAHKQLTWSLARQALQQSSDMGWQLIHNPNRLRIQTIDSLCQTIASDLPILSRLGGRLSPADNPTQLYHQAVSDLMLELDDNSVIGQSLADLLLHLDNNLSRLYDLFVSMLGRRDQWLDFALGYNHQLTNDNDLATTLSRWIEEQLGDLREQLLPFESDLCPLARFAAEQAKLGYAEKGSHIEHLSDLYKLPDASKEAIPIWLGLFSLLLTKASRCRKTVNKGQGFPAKGAAVGESQTSSFEYHKMAMVSLLSAIASQPGVEDVLAITSKLSSATYEPGHHQILKPLTQCLIRLYGHLRLVFGLSGECDYTEITIAALEALSGSYLDNGGHTPTAIAHKWNRDICHILVDEFQDTSVSQFNLIQTLTSEWYQENALQTSPPRTLFIVGDGMQSIYSFRAAKVGLFVRAKENGIGDLPLITVELVSNFRSSATIVDWNNEAYSKIFPADVNYSTGAVPYAYSQSIPENNDDASKAEIIFYAKKNNRFDEALKIVDEIKLQQSQLASATIAILVRSRSHLTEIIPALNRADITWSGVDLDPLKDREVTLDCLSLVKALLNPADTLSWLAILRAPWCGLTLPDIQRLADVDAVSAETSHSEPVNHSIVDTTGAVKPSLNKVVNYLLTGIADAPMLLAIDGLTESGVLRLQFIAEKIQHSWLMRSRLPLRQWLENLWTQLHGETLARYSFHQDDRDSAVAFFNLIETLDQAEILGGKKFTISLLEDELQRLFALPAKNIQSGADELNAVQIMTIHKAKGLEFDSVILPGLDRGGRSDSKPLLYWNEHLFKDDTKGLVLCPIDAVADLNGEKELLEPLSIDELFCPSPIKKAKNNSPLYQFLADENKRMQAYEAARLLYVATTRAKSKLLLIAALNVNDDDLPNEPATNCLLHTLWPAINKTTITYSKDSISALTRSEPAYPLLKRLKSHYFNRPVKGINDQSRMPSDSDISKQFTPNVIFSDQTSEQIAPLIGTCIHEVFEIVNSVSLDGSLRVISRPNAWRARLLQLGVSTYLIDEALAVVVDAVNKMNQSSIASWLFSPEHQQVKNEWSLSCQGVNEELKHFVIDRSFIDADKTRWIIDYKIARQGDVSVTQFVALQKHHYSAQLHNYYHAIKKFDHDFNSVVEKTQCALYLPLIDQLILIDSPSV